MVLQVLQGYLIHSGVPKLIWNPDLSATLKAIPKIREAIRIPKRPDFDE